MSGPTQIVLLRGLARLLRASPGARVFAATAIRVKPSEAQWDALTGVLGWGLSEDVVDFADEPIDPSAFDADRDA